MKSITLLLLTHPTAATGVTAGGRVGLAVVNLHSMHVIWTGTGRSVRPKPNRCLHRCSGVLCYCALCVAVRCAFVSSFAVCCVTVRSFAVCRCVLCYCERCRGVLSRALRCHCVLVRCAAVCCSLQAGSSIPSPGLVHCRQTSAILQAAVE